MRDFYLATLAPLVYTTYLETAPRFLGLRGRAGPDFWLHGSGADVPLWRAGEDPPPGATHVAFAVESRAKVDEWYRGAVKAGGVPNGEPGVRKEYSQDYYAAYVLDPLGNNIEAVYFAPLWLRALQAAPWVVTGLVGAGVGIAATMYMK